MHFLRVLSNWLVNRFKKTLDYDMMTHFWLYGVCYVLTVSMALLMIYSNPTVNILSIKLIESAQVFMMITFGFFIVAFILAFIFSLIYVPLPRFSFATLVITIALISFIFWESDSGLKLSLIIGFSVPILSVLACLLVVLIWKWRPVMLGFFALTVATLIAGLVMSLEAEQQSFIVQDEAVPFDLLEQGDYETAFYTYGSGTDIKRSEFGDDVDTITKTVDASDFIHRWKNNRESFWGFTPENLPINGRVWMPKGEGPFPVILMVHGNHSMEEYSTDGYDYLGKHLASKGFVFISVDEDFVNYSYYSNQPNDNYQLRTWLLLQHLGQLKQLNMTHDNFLYDKLDLTHVGLAGHSRGGQAVAMAADYESFFEEDTDLQEMMSGIHISSVLAISPTDKLVDDKRAQLLNTSYMVIQGAQDADVYQFYGDKQYGRTTLLQSFSTIKSAVYIEKANHVHFNTSWGHTDLSIPRGLLLDRYTLVPATEQQKLAKIYATAFFERTLLNELSLEAFFQKKPDWTNVSIIDKYETNRYKPITSYENIDDIQMTNVTNLTTDFTTGRSNNDYYKKALQFDWKKGTTYNVHLNENDLTNNIYQRGECLYLTIANLKPKTQPNLNITLKSKQHKVVSTQSVSEVIETNFTHFGLFDDLFREGKYEKSWEPVYETIAIPIDKQMANASNLDVTIEFEEGQGRVAILEIGIE